MEQYRTIDCEKKTNKQKTKQNKKTEQIYLESSVDPPLLPLYRLVNARMSQVRDYLFSLRGYVDRLDKVVRDQHCASAHVCV